MIRTRITAMGVAALVALAAVGTVGAAAATPSGNEAAAVAPQQERTHTIVWGDTLARLAARYGSTVGAIAQANGIANPDLIYAGDTLIIPTAGTASTQPREAARRRTAAPTSVTPVSRGVATAPATTTAGTLTEAKVAKAARDAGWPEGSISTVVRIARCESSFRTGAVGAAGEVGLMQIHPVHRDLHARYNLYDPVQNLRAAREVHAGAGWRAWSCA